MFMFVEVPEPVWNASIGNWSVYAPAAISSATATIASATRRSTGGTSLEPAFTRAASPLIMASARITRGSTAWPEIGKFSTARWVCAPQSASVRHPHLAHRVVLDAELAHVSSCSHLRERYAENGLLP